MNLPTNLNLPIIFIADLHLSDEVPKLNQLFFEFLQRLENEPNQKIQALYILGDLFDAWTGDDDDSETAQQVAIQLKKLSEKTAIYFIAGNRDFLLGKKFAQKSGITILPENHLITVNCERGENGKSSISILLTHGDEMCSQDIDYLKYRKIIRKKWVQKLFLSLPFAKRKEIAQKIRTKSKQQKQQIGKYEISDVTEQGFQTACANFPQIDVLIHGHTHRPNIHEHQFNGKKIMRYVLPDWYQAQGGFLKLEKNGSFHFETLSLNEIE